MFSTLKLKNLVLKKGRPVVCVPVTGSSDDEILSEIQLIKQTSAQMVEWRADFYEKLSDSKSLNKIIKKIFKELEGLPFIFTIRTKEEGGNANITKKEYLEANKLVCESNYADIIDVELNLGDELVLELINKAKDENVKVIVSKHDFKKTPTQTEMVASLIKMQKLGADIAKLAVMPNTKKDLLTLLAATDEMYSDHAKIPIVTMSMGKIGISSRILGEVFGSAITFGSVKRASAPGQIPADELSEVLDIINKNIKEEANNIILIGFMGTGKTTVSKELAKMYGMKIVDSDQYIEEKEGMKIHDMFEKYGEQYFRDLESEAIKEILNNKNQIISCGGGIILRDENVENMKKNGNIVLLTASPSTILERVKKDNNRPLLSSNVTKEDIIKLLEKRKSRYYGATDIYVDTDDKSVGEICEEIVNKIL